MHQHQPDPKCDFYLSTIIPAMAKGGGLLITNHRNFDKLKQSIADKAHQESKTVYVFPRMSKAYLAAS
jgi:hypothetical protein